MFRTKWNSSFMFREGGTVRSCSEQRGTVRSCSEKEEQFVGVQNKEEQFVHVQKWRNSSFCSEK